MPLLVAVWGLRLISELFLEIFLGGEKWTTVFPHGGKGSPCLNCLPYFALLTICHHWNLTKSHCTIIFIQGKTLNDLLFSYAFI
jgi:hypothetical protein